MGIMSKKVTVFGRSISAVLFALVAIGGLASAGLLTIYGRVVGTAVVAQSVTLDGNQCTGTAGQGCTVYESIPAVPGGEKHCFIHALYNGASVSTNVNFQNACNPTLALDCTGITTTYNGLEGGPFASINQPGSGQVDPNFAHGLIYVQDLGTSVRWTFNITDVAAHYGVGLALSKDGITPAFQVYFAEFGDNLWHYQPYGSTCWSGVDTTVLPSGISASGNAASNIFTITIDKSLMGGAPSWMSQVRTLLLGVYPGWTPWCGPFVMQPLAGSSLSQPLTLLSGQTKNFYTCYQFAINIQPDTYTITTDVVPA